jgi:hypothetical protein
LADNFAVESIPKIGNIIIGNSDVMPNGIVSVIHKNAINTTIANILDAVMLEGKAGKIKKMIKSKTPIKN